jgi:hypothetical protein
MTRGPAFITHHAVQRYIERHRPGWTEDSARADLQREIGRAVLYERPAGEDPIYITQRGVLLVVSGDGAVRTVLPAGSRATNRRPRR